MKISHHIIGRGTLRSGYVLLFSVIVIGAIASGIVASLLMLGTTASQVGIASEYGTKAFALAGGCAEYALQALRTSTNYAGNETKSYASGTCEILTIGGVGNNDRMICIEGTAGSVTRRLEIIVSQVLPKTRIDSWQEVSSFSLCE